jgi:hypothetical protein
MGGAVYFTGVPGIGKSTVISSLESSIDFELKVFSYSEHLGAHLGRPRAELRAESSNVVMADVVRQVDEALAAFVQRHRSDSLVIIDSHAVTDEVFGCRVIPFQPLALRSLSLDLIICLTRHGRHHPEAGRIRPGWAPAPLDRADRAHPTAPRSRRRQLLGATRNSALRGRRGRRGAVDCTAS